MGFKLVGWVSGGGSDGGGLFGKALEVGLGHLVGRPSEQQSVGDTLKKHERTEVHTSKWLCWAWSR